MSLESLASFTESEVHMPMTAKQFQEWAARQPPRTGYEDMNLNRYHDAPDVLSTPGARGRSRDWSAAINEEDLGSPQE